MCMINKSGFLYLLTQLQQQYMCSSLYVCVLCTVNRLISGWLAARGNCPLLFISWDGKGSNKFEYETPMHHSCSRSNSIIHQTCSPLYPSLSFPLPLSHTPPAERVAGLLRCHSQHYGIHKISLSLSCMQTFSTLYLALLCIAAALGS